MADKALVNQTDLSQKLNVVIALLLHFAAKDEDFNDGKRKTGDLASFLRNHGLEYTDIAAILGSPIASLRVLVSIRKRSGAKKKKK